GAVPGQEGPGAAAGPAPGRWVVPGQDLPRPRGPGSRPRRGHRARPPLHPGRPAAGGAWGGPYAADDAAGRPGVSGRGTDPVVPRALGAGAGDRRAADAPGTAAAGQGGAGAERDARGGGAGAVRPVAGALGDAGADGRGGGGRGAGPGSAVV